MGSKIRQALPLLLGALLGVLLQYLALPVMPRLFLGIFPIIIGFMVYVSASHLMTTNPVMSVKVWQFQMLIPIGAIALATWGLADLIAMVPGYVQDSGWFDPTAACVGAETDEARQDCVADRYKEISTAISGAITVFLGSIFLKDLEGQEGGWWPPAQIQARIKAVYADDVERRQKEMDAAFAQIGDPPDPAKKEAWKDVAKKYERLKRAVYEPSLSNAEPVGWSRAGAIARAGVLKEQLPELVTLRQTYP